MVGQTDTTEEVEADLAWADVDNKAEPQAWMPQWRNLKRLSKMEHPESADRAALRILAAEVRRLREQQPTD